ncbi:MAG: DedA family protein [Deltaproteobacteria bacterium]|nr:DedA family protein [Deltaproteobacteria bacterium]
MMTFLSHYGYGVLFILSFLASTIIPLGSEWLLVAMVIKGFDPVLSVSTATAGNTLGACTTYGIGAYGSAWVIRKLLRFDELSRKRAEMFYAKFGAWSLLFSWLPIVGDPLCLAGGLLRIHFGVFLLLVFVGKLIRYGLLAVLVM